MIEILITRVWTRDIVIKLNKFVDARLKEVLAAKQAARYEEIGSTHVLRQNMY